MHYDAIVNSENEKAAHLFVRQFGSVKFFNVMFKIKSTAHQAVLFKLARRRQVASRVSMDLPGMEWNADSGS
jgi:hypothetical protein